MANCNYNNNLLIIFNMILHKFTIFFMIYAPVNYHSAMFIAVKSRILSAEKYISCINNNTPILYLILLMYQIFVLLSIKILLCWSSF